jgi:hypothetical protein
VEELPHLKKWREEFADWPDSKLRVFAEINPQTFAPDEQKNFARTVLAEREEARRKASEDRLQRHLAHSDFIGWLAIGLSIVAIIFSVVFQFILR